MAQYFNAPSFFFSCLRRVGDTAKDKCGWVAERNRDEEEEERKDECGERERERGKLLLAERAEEQIEAKEHRGKSQPKAPGPFLPSLLPSYLSLEEPMRQWVRCSLDRSIYLALLESLVLSLSVFRFGKKPVAVDAASAAPAPAAVLFALGFSSFSSEAYSIT